MAVSPGTITQLVGEVGPILGSFTLKEVGGVIQIATVQVEQRVRLDHPRAGVNQVATLPLGLHLLFATQTGATVE